MFYQRVPFTIISAPGVAAVAIGTHSGVIKKYINSGKHKYILSASIKQCHIIVVFPGAKIPGSPFPDRSGNANHKIS